MVMMLVACAPVSSDPLSFNPELFTRKSNTSDECQLSIDQVSTSFPNPNTHDALIRLTGTMTENCANLQIGMQQPDIGKNIRVEMIAATTTAPGGSERPFVVELSSRALRYGKYTIWVNGTAETIFSVE